MGIPVSHDERHKQLRETDVENGIVSKGHARGEG